MFHTFFDNMILLIGAFFISIKLVNRVDKKTSGYRPNIWASSIHASLISVLIMLNSYMHKGMVFDIRGIPVFLVSYLYGWKAGLISCILPTIFRYYIGGSTIWQGIAMGIIIPGMVGFIFYKPNKNNEKYRLFSIKRILIAYLIYCIIRFFLMPFIIPVSYSLWLMLNINMTIVSLISLLCIVLIINDSNKNMLLGIEMDEKQKKIEKLNSELFNSNNTLISLLDVMPVGIIVCDIKGNIILTNKTSTNILGKNANRLGGRLANSQERAYFLHELDGTEIPLKELPYWETIEKGRVIKDIEMLLRRKDKKERIIIVSSTPIHDENNKITNGVIVLNDITHLKIIEDTLRDGRKISEAFLNGITEVLILVDRKGTILELNETCASAFKLKIEEAKGLNIFDLLLPELKQKMKNCINNFIEGGKKVSFEEKLKEKYFNIVLYPILDNHQQMKKFVVFAKDVTKIKEADKIRNRFIKELANEQQKLEDKNHKLTLLSKQHMATLEVLYKKNEELKVANRSKNSFIANVSHELKTPLNITMTYLEYLLEEQDEELSEEQKEMLKVAYNNADRLQYLINDLLDISLIEAQKINFDFKEINLTTFLNTLITDRNLTIKGKNINIKFSIPQKDIFIITDMFRLRQVVDNILDNAIKFSCEGDIEVSLKEKTNNIDIYVKDNGIGIDQDKMDSIFKPFYQVDDSSKKKYKGVGLGLYISQKIINALGGEISVENNSEQGCCFKVSLPIIESLG
ncbi:MAG: ATP-binding protein [Maledivibacter sp.]|nr:ATP-binding protein [Maledivibacter sp.]